ncbi:hypothetical protein DMC30DRAFT_404684 [Rhodotorula diobovata]|uniref:Secreted protein n=1 Tax=Rhodotorula diobovata TaxID=5288 RepID=A0A5C5FLZ9_9BASI|nr:hypothetical protein DMC30DRAFT_404684 [Rhodotorula diobovata]
MPTSSRRSMPLQALSALLTLIPQPLLAKTRPATQSALTCASCWPAASAARRALRPASEVAHGLAYRSGVPRAWQARLMRTKRARAVCGEEPGVSRRKARMWRASSGGRSENEAGSCW